MRRGSLLVIALVFCLPIIADEKQEDLIPKEFDRYRFVILKMGPNAGTMSGEESRGMLLKHLAHLRDLNRSGELLVYGPFAAGKTDELRGIAIFRGDVPLERVREVMDRDPFVQQGAMVYEVHTWMTAKGQMQATPPAK